MSNIHHTVCQQARVSTSARWANHEYIPMCCHGQVLFADKDFIPDFLLCPTSFIHSFFPSFVLPLSSPSFLPPNSSCLSLTGRTPSTFHRMGHSSIQTLIQTSERREQMPQGVQTPSTHASSISRTAQHQPVRPSVLNACKAQTTPRETIPVERREKRAVRTSSSVYRSMVEWLRRVEVDVGSQA